MAKLRRTLLIGLGGTGFRSILNAKKMFYDTYGEIPPMIGFLGIDTDRPGLENAFVMAKDGTRITLNSSEQLPICVDEPQEIYQRNSASGLFDWIPRCNTQGLSTLTIGAGQIRSNGRFAITVNENLVLSLIQRKLTEINDARIIDNTRYDLLGADPEVHMVFSLGGGTGSGTFINTAYLIKRLLPKVKISGYAVMSDVFRTMVSGAMSSRVRPNAKGALIDLDYLAHLTVDSEPVEVKWFHKTDSVTYRPFNALYMVDNRNANNDSFASVDPICQMISLAIVTSVGELGVTLDSISDNVEKLISDGAMDIENKKAWVAGFGCAEIVFDGGRLAEIYANKAAIQLVNIMLNGGCDDPAVIANTWFDSTRIRENLGKDDVIDYFMAPIPPFTLQELDNPDNPLPECDSFIANRAMEKPAALNDKLEALEKRVDDSLSHLMTEQANRECGVFLCGQILTSILKQIELCDGEMKEEIDNLESELPMRRSSLESACKELADCMSSFFKRGRREFTEDVISGTMTVATISREIERRKMARQFYSWLRVRVGQSINRVDVISNNLQAVRDECGNRVQKLMREGAASSFFQFDLAAERAETVVCPLSDIIFNNFIAMIRQEGGVQAINTMTSGETYDTILRFTSAMTKTKEFEAKTIDDVLDEMTDGELRDLLSRAIKKSLPLLDYSYRGFEASLRERPVESYYVGIAGKAASRLCRNNLFKSLVPGAEDVQFSETGLRDRVIVYRQLGVVPVFTLKALDNYETEYEKWESDKPHGSHWDNNLCERMNRERFSIKPRSVLPDLLELWVDAVVNKLVNYDQASGQYRVKSPGMGGRALRGFLVDMGATREEAFRYLEDNIDILEPEIKRDLREMDKPGPQNPIKANIEKAKAACRDNTYLEEVSQCPIPRSDIEHYPAEDDMIEREMLHILNNY